MFPTVYSTLSSEALVDRVLSQYDIGPVQSCQFWNRGLSDVYVVTAGDRPYVLRVSHSHWRSRDDIHFELAFLDFLHRRGLPVAYPLRAARICAQTAATNGKGPLSGDSPGETLRERNGSTPAGNADTSNLSVEIEAPEGKRYAALFVYAPGEIPLGDLNPAQGRALGETLARIHGTAAEFRCAIPRQPLTLDYLLDRSFEAIAPFLEGKTAHQSDLLQTIGRLREKLADLPQEPPFWTICWGDPHSGNAHFTGDRELTLFDFDQCGYGWRAFDLGKFLQIGLRTGLPRSVREAFLGGYESVQPLSDRERAALQSFVGVAHIWSWAIGLHAAKLHNYCRLDDGYFVHRLQQLKMLDSPEWQLF